MASSCLSIWHSKLQKVTAPFVYLVDEERIDKRIKHIAEANDGRMMSVRTFDFAFSSHDNSIIDLSNMSIARIVHSNTLSGSPIKFATRDRDSSL